MAAPDAVIERLGQEVFEFPGLETEMVFDSEEDTTQGVLTRLLEEARSHYDGEIEPDQTDATDYYHGRPFGDEKKGRSKVVSTDIRDVTLGQLPDLIQLFMGPDNMLEFEPRTAAEVDRAEQQTDYVNHLVWDDNPGFLTILGQLQDGLVRRLGIVKWWWEVSSRLVEDQYTGLSYEQFVTLVTDKDVDDFEIENVREEPEWKTEVYDVRIQRWTVTGIARFEGVPNEEFLFTPNARTLEKSQVVAHSREVPVDEVVALGYDYEDLKEFIGEKRRVGAEDLDAARQIHGGVGNIAKEDGDSARAPILFTEAYAWVDTDGDHIGELRMFHCAGPGYKVLPDPDTGSTDGLAVERVPFSVFTPYPEPHTIIGLCNYDLLKDIQRIKSQVLRGNLDSLAQAIDSQMEVVHNEVNMRDVLSPEVTKVIRVRKPGMIREVKHTYVGGETITALEYMDEVRAERTGRTRASEGLDPDSLQSSTKEAVHATLGKNQARVYMIAQVYAETALKDLFQGLHELVIKHQDYARTVRMRGKFVEVDPRHWDASLRLKVNVALGIGTPMERAAVLGEILTRQEMYIEKGVPFVDFTHLRRTLDRITKLVGYKNPEEFWGRWGAQEQQMHQQALAQNPQKDPAMEIVETERLKIQQEHIQKGNELDLKREEMNLEHAREMRQLKLKEEEIEAKFATSIADAGVKLTQTQIQAEARKATPTPAAK